MFNERRDKMTEKVALGNSYVKHLERVERLKEIAESKNVEVSHIVLSFYLTHHLIDAVIPGARNSQQVIDNLKATEVTLTTEEQKYISELF